MCLPHEQFQMLVPWGGWKLFLSVNHNGFQNCQATFAIWPDSLILLGWESDGWQPARLTGREADTLQYLAVHFLLWIWLVWDQVGYIMRPCTVCCAVKSTAFPCERCRCIVYFFFFLKVLSPVISSEQSAICCGPSTCFVQLREKLQREEMSIFIGVTQWQRVRVSKIPSLIWITLSHWPVRICRIEEKLQMMFGDLPETSRVDKVMSHSQKLLVLSWWYFPTFNDPSANLLLWESCDDC